MDEEVEIPPLDAQVTDEELDLMRADDQARRTMREVMAPVIARIAHGWFQYVDIGPGWYPLVLALDATIARIHPDYKIQQVKEKFGTLRFYCDHDGDPKVESLIELAERVSAITCEQCGARGRLRIRRGWDHVRCDAHAKPDEDWEEIEPDDPGPAERPKFIPPASRDDTIKIKD